MRSSSGELPVAAGQAAWGTSELRVKLVWLTVFRTVATTLLLATIAARTLSQPFSGELSREDSSSFLIIVLVYLATVVYGLVLRSKKVGPSAAYVQVFGDIVLASALVYLTGGAESPLTFTYSIAVVAASILLYQRGALIAAGASSFAYATLVALLHENVLRPPMGSAPLSGPRMAFLVATNTLAQFLIAALASFLSKQLRATGGRLSEREADLAEMARLQRQILACMPSGLITCEANGTITFVNKAAAALLELKDGEHPPTQIETLIPGVLKLGISRRSELTVETPQGKKTLGLNTSPLEGKDGSLLVVFQDLTDLRRVETELKRIDHLAALGTLAAQLAHEIRNPLASMRGSAQMLSDEVGADRALTNILLRESDRLSALVEDFLRFARPPPPSLRPCALDRLVADTVELLRADPLSGGVQIELRLAPVTALADGDQMRQVLLNLLRNAFIAVGPGGMVRVEVDERLGAPAIRVWDSAGSIPKTDLQRIFDPFFTTREGGTGLGLSTAHSIVRAHGGMIQVSSSREAGTEFVVGLPSTVEGALADPGR